MTSAGRSLEDLQGAFLDAPCMDLLGDTISYRPAGAAYKIIKAYVDASDAAFSIETGKIMAQDMTVELLVTDAPIKPSAASRLRIAAIAGEVFRPINVRRSRSGTHWAFELERVNV